MSIGVGGDGPAYSSGGMVVHAVAPYGGHLRNLVKELKYEGKTQHGAYLGHLLLQRLEQHFDPHSVDLVLANPTHPGRPIRHTELLLAHMAAADRDLRWAFDDPSRPCLVKTRPSLRSYGQTAIGRRHAGDDLFGALKVVEPLGVVGRSLVIVDDVMTTGAQLDAVATKLREHGASAVAALVLAVTAPSLEHVDPTPADTALSGRVRLRRAGVRAASPPDAGGVSL